jgi:hypothetical protein
MGKRKKVNTRLATQMAAKHVACKAEFTETESGAEGSIVTTLSNYRLKGQCQRSAYKAVEDDSRSIIA